MTTTAGEISAPVRMPDGFCIGGNWTGFRVLKGSAFLGTRTRRRRNWVVHRPSGCICTTP